MKISSYDRRKIATNTACELTKENPDILATACPLCKKTISSVTKTRVADISEIVAEALNINLAKRNIISQVSSIKELVKI